VEIFSAEILRGAHFNRAEKILSSGENITVARVVQTPAVSSQQDLIAPDCVSVDLTPASA
jgi:hypothetical protein